MNKYLVIGIITILIVVGGGYYLFNGSGKLGSTTDCISNTCLTSLYVSGTSAVGGTLEVAATSTFSGNVLVPTVANATSTFTVGCVNVYATSSATAIKLTFNTQATTSIGGTANGAVTWRYGSCQ